MTTIEPKEKAKELVLKFSPLVTTWYCYWDTPRNEDDVREDAKQCALIEVDEMIKAFWGTHKNETEYRYWQQVKTEIENL